MAPPGPAAENTGFVSVGIDRDTAQFSVAAITAWWDQLGRQRYPDATSLQITADCGGSNGNRTRLWKTELQRLADHTRLQISVCHFPPGTSNGTRSSIGCSASSPRTGAADHWPPTR